jgi:hypothetical protein
MKAFAVGQTLIRAAIPSEARNLLFARIEEKTDSSLRLECQRGAFFQLRVKAWAPSILETQLTTCSVHYERPGRR